MNGRGQNIALYCTIILAFCALGTMNLMGQSAIRADVDRVYAEVGGLRDNVHAEVGGLRAEIGGLRDSVHAEVGGLRDNVHAEIGGLRAEIDGLRDSVSVGFTRVDERLDRIDQRLSRVEGHLFGAGSEEQPEP